ncbi:kinetochore protein Mis14 like-domain-containing protein [Aspergillus welwitschiae]|uniref:Kinetochore protein Mis14 like-domain-containing protein n=1 Tax=Aspergillus welwitschiae TaxID=1341132 RepID=A0A3F3Q6I8_9EURO|nr:kinetochore protein Mis14 like-domain-containing protein [Aspergillus welwitschiae]RDH34532.1 kinetochore protein Mis14 like-domain-containing protein [Aspergillus welwitschiae]
MSTDHHRKIELQSPADFTYLYANTVALSRAKLDLHLPPSANPNDGPDPMRERVRELVDEVIPYPFSLPPQGLSFTIIHFAISNNNGSQYINRTFNSASPSISINGLDSTSPEWPFPAAFTAPTEQVEYEAYDGKLASRVTSLYAQLESLTTTVAQLRRDAPGRAAKAYAEQLRSALREDEQETEEEEEEEMKEEEDEEGQQQQGGGQDAEMTDAGSTTASTQRKGPMTRSRAKLEVSLGTENEAERWRSGEMAEVYEDALRTLLRLQGEGVSGAEVDSSGDGADGNALSSTLGKAERAGRAVEVVEKKEKKKK